MVQNYEINFETPKRFFNRFHCQKLKGFPFGKPLFMLLNFH